MNTVDLQEIENFRKDSNKWWDPDGPFKPLHNMNPVRIGYIRDRILESFEQKTDKSSPLKGLSILDVGCGGGLACEPLARLGANVTGVDADDQAIEVAGAHAAQSELKITYIHGSSEDLIDQKPRYDIVLGLEIIEHVKDTQAFVSSLSELCKPGGLIIMSTLNRTPKSFALGIVATEYILGWVPKGTHEWKKFIKPSELSELMRRNALKPIDIKGITYDPFENDFDLSDRDMGINYIITAKKTG